MINTDRQTDGGWIDTHTDVIPRKLKGSKNVRFLELYMEGIQRPSSIVTFKLD